MRNTNREFWDIVDVEYRKESFRMEVDIYKRKLAEGNITREAYTELVSDAAIMQGIEWVAGD